LTLLDRGSEYERNWQNSWKESSHRWQGKATNQEVHCQIRRPGKAICGSSKSRQTFWLKDRHTACCICDILKTQTEI
jgi:hypothetical protein